MYFSLFFLNSRNPCLLALNYKTLCNLPDFLSLTNNLDSLYKHKEKKKLDLRVIGSANISLDDFYSFDDFIST